MPESVWLKDDDVRKSWVEAMRSAHIAYNVACDAGVSYQDARFILPEGTTSYIMMEYPLREFMNVYAYRGCYMFQWEIVSIMHTCRDLLVSKYPFLDPYIKISCEKTKGALDGVASGKYPSVAEEEGLTHHCTFQGWESVEGQCPFAWARESNRSFRSEHHRIERTEK
jgi:thymidylate synthase ThyX